MDILTLGNLLPYTLQVVCLAALATGLAWLVRIDSASVRYAYWRLVLGASVALPFVQPAGRFQGAIESGASQAASVATATGAASTAAAVAPFDWGPVIVTVLALGVCVRLLRVAAGAISLRRLRGFGAPANDAPHIVALQQTLGTRADVRQVPALEQPATFGVIRPVVLLPGNIGEQPLEIQRALVAHELVHVQRRDWFWVLCEELLLSLCWFNPAMWWIVSEVRRTREESVDEIAILATGSRRTYVQALLAFAGDTSLAPAPAFAHRRHLFRRITLISTEAAMSSTRIVVSCAVMAIVIAAGSTYVAAAFPLSEATQSPTLQTQGPGPVEKRANAVTAERPVPQRTDYQAAEYPLEARTAGVSGAITLRITLDEVGRVVESRRVGFAIRIASPEITASFTNTSAEAIVESIGRSHSSGQGQAIVRALDALTMAASFAVSNWRYEPPKGGPIAFDVAIRFSPDGETGSAHAAPVREARLVTGSPLQDAVRVGGNIKPPTKILDVRPVYPLAAQKARVTGMVIVEARIGADGSVETAQVLRSIPLLDEAALEAVRQWKFTPTLLNGVPVPVMMTMTVNFSLQ